MGRISISCWDLNKGQSILEIEHRPDTCPICHHAIQLSEHLYAYLDTKTNVTQVVHRCPRIACQNVFIAKYHLVPGTNLLVFVHCVPTTHVHINFSDAIAQLSPEFCDIYNQALAAEDDGLTKVCGVGYRKSLEFLIKDYLIQAHPDKAEEIKGKFLGRCIDEYIANENIKAVAKRATWLGNDETHYARLWDGRDLEDLKRLIDLTVRWIEMEQLTKQAVKEMPEPRK